MSTLNVLRGLAAAAKSTKTTNKNRYMADSPNGKWERTYNQREACDATNLHPRKIIAACKELSIDYKDGNKFCISATDVKKLNEQLGMRITRPPGSELAVWCVTQQKGGSTKTTLAATIAAGLATECFNNWRIGVIDMDPQATATMLLKPNFDDSMFSVGDLLTDNIKLGENETFESVCKSSFYQTNLPSLRVLCARDEDRHYETHVERNRIAANKENAEYTSYRDLDRIINAVKDDFDILIVDTSPYFSAATYTAHYSANNIIVPVRPSENDTDSSEKYFDQLADIYEILAGMGHTGYENIIVQPAAVKQSPSHIETIARIRNTYFGHCSQYDFADSDAVLNCAKQYSTIYDVSASEYVMGSNKSLLRVQNLTLQIIKDIETKSRQFWSNK
jgi:chromosome partitioning protein